MVVTYVSRNIHTSTAFTLLPKLESIISVTKTAHSVIKKFQTAGSKETTESDTFSTTITSTAMMNTVPAIPSLSKTAKRVYWIRHGEVVNPGAAQNKSVFYGSMDVSLSSFGQQEAIAAGKFLSQRDVVGPLSKIYSSNLTRAIYGAEQVRILQQKQEEGSDTSPPLEVTQVPGFMELDRGEWCGKTLQEIGPEQMDKFNYCDDSVTPLGGESYREFNDRVMKGRNDIVLQQLEFGQCAAVVSHLQVTRCIVADALQRPLQEVSKIPIATASITCIDYEYSDATKDGESNTDETNLAKLPSSQVIHFQSYKPDTGLRKSIDGAN